MPEVVGRVLPARNRLQHMVLAAQRAIKAAGFKPGAFMPQGDKLKIEVLVPVTFDFGMAYGSGEDVRSLLHRAVDNGTAFPSGVTMTIPARRGPGRPRKVI